MALLSQLRIGNDVMALKKRYVKRIVRKIVFFLLTIAFISLVTTMIVETRIKRVNQEPDESSLDPNGDLKTPPFQTAHAVPPTRRAPRPPYQDRRLARDPIPGEGPQPDNVAPVLDANRLEELKVEDDTIFRLPVPKGPRKDWHDYDFMERDAARFGLGEQGRPAHNDPSEKELERHMFLENGFNALLSNKISVNRSVPDVRREECKSRQYLAELPNISVIFIFFNEHFGVLLRSVYSIIRRTPPELLKQIVLVNDGSDRHHLKKQVDNYTATYWRDLVVVVHNANRSGLIAARLAGAKVATGDVLVFFDSHIEVNYNWLPPLIEPIAINSKISTCPIVDVINHDTFEYGGREQVGSRGGFDWAFYYKQLPVLPEDSVDKSLPYRNPVMMGGLFAIDRQFFWELGGYDDKLDIWGGEQYELSFKIWMCGGMLLDVPCSRVAHIFRGEMAPRPNPRKYNFVATNHKRVAEVWMDEYKQYVYARNPEVYGNIDVGDVSAQRALRERLHCKSFDWYMKEVAPDFLIKFPPVEPPNYASGAIKSLSHPTMTYCLDTMSRSSEKSVGLYPCANNLTHPQSNQFWTLSNDRELRLKGQSTCLDVHHPHPNATVYMWNCHNMGGNQFWYFNREHLWLVHGLRGHRCLEALFIDNEEPKVVVNNCDPKNARMRWNFGEINDKLLDKFFEGL